jgi:hypothetical protein
MNQFNEIEWTKLDNAASGSPRYVCSWVSFGTKTYAEAVALANKIGGTKYDNKSYGGGIVFHTYNPKHVEKQIKHLFENMHLYVKYTGVLFFVHSLYINKAGELVQPTFEQRMIDAGKPEDQREYSLVQLSEILGRVFVDKQYQLIDAANQYAKDNELHIDYGIACIKNL